MEISGLTQSLGAVAPLTSPRYRGSGGGSGEGSGSGSGSSGVPSLFFPKDEVSIGKNGEEDDSSATYNANGIFGSSGDQSEADSATIAKLKARDQNVRDKEKSKGDAVGAAAYIYQIGPDGQKYAIGTAPHAVTPKGDESGGSASSNSGELPAASSPALQAGGGHATSAAHESPEEKADIKQLENRDSEVKAHESAHIAASGGGAGSPVYDYQTGPDGKVYAIGGSVNISTTNVPGNPDASRQNANALERAAMAPGEPSGQDYKVAAEARKMRTKADEEENRLNNVKAEKAEEDGSEMASKGAIGQNYQMRNALLAYLKQNAA